MLPESMKDKLEMAIGDKKNTGDHLRKFAPPSYGYRAGGMVNETLPSLAAGEA